VDLFSHNWTAGKDLQKGSLMPDKEIIFQRLYSIEAMLDVLAKRIEGIQDVSAVEMAVGIADYMAQTREDVQALVYALEQHRKTIDEE
jgi:hypothetical protein